MKKIIAVIVTIFGLTSAVWADNISIPGIFTLSLEKLNYQTVVTCQGFTSYSPYGSPINFRLDNGNRQKKFSASEATQPFIILTHIDILSREDWKMHRFNSSKSYFTVPDSSQQEIFFVPEMKEGQLQVAVSYEPSGTQAFLIMKEDK